MAKATSPARDSPAPRLTAAAGRPRAARAAGVRIHLNEDEIYRRIYDAVLDHRLHPGTKLKEVALAQVFGANRSVVRKVLTRLSYDRLVALRPNRGAVVASPSIEESKDLFAARRAVEAAIVEAVTRNISRDESKSLRALAESERDAYKRGQIRRGLKLSLKFHRQLAAIAGNGVLAGFLDQLVARTPLVILAYRSRGGGRTCSIDEHLEIVDLIAAGNVAKAVAAMTAHLDTLEGQLDLTDDAEPSTDLAELFGNDDD